MRGERATAPAAREVVPGEVARAEATQEGLMALMTQERELAG